MTSLPLSVLVVTEGSEQGASLVICGGHSDTHTAGFQVAREGPASAHRPWPRAHGSLDFPGLAHPELSVGLSQAGMIAGGLVGVGEKPRQSHLFSLSIVWMGRWRPRNLGDLSNVMTTEAGLGEGTRSGIKDVGGWGASPGSLRQVLCHKTGNKNGVLVPAPPYPAM